MTSIDLPTSQEQVATYTKKTIAQELSWAAKRADEVHLINELAPQSPELKIETAKLVAAVFHCVNTGEIPVIVTPDANPTVHETIEALAEVTDSVVTNLLHDRYESAMNEVVSTLEDRNAHLQEETELLRIENDLLQIDNPGVYELRQERDALEAENAELMRLLAKKDGEIASVRQRKEDIEITAAKQSLQGSYKFLRTLRAKGSVAMKAFKILPEIDQ